MTRNEQWPIIAAGLKLPLEPLPGSQILRSSAKIGIDLREFFLRILGGLEILWEKTKSATSDTSNGSDATRRRAADRPPNIAQPRSLWMAQSDSGSSRDSHLPTPQTGRTTVQHLQVSDLTLPQAPQPARDSYHNSTSSTSYPSASQANYGSSSQYPYSQSYPSTYSQSSAAPRPTASPVETDRSGHADATRPYSNNASTSSSTSSARQNGTGASQADYDPPVVRDFDQLVNSQLLPLPAYGGNAPLPHFTSKSLEYAWRAHELRASIRKMSAAEQHRTVTSEEVLWWNRLGESWRGGRVRGFSSWQSRCCRRIRAW